MADEKNMPKENELDEKQLDQISGGNSPINGQKDNSMPDISSEKLIFTR